MPNEEIEAKVLARAHTLFTEYEAQHGSHKEALMAAVVKLAKLEFAEEARMNREKKWPF